MSPTLPYPDEVTPGPIDRIGAAVRRAGAAIGVDQRVPFRLLACLALGVVSVTFAPTPWAQLGALALVLIGVDVVRLRQYNAGTRQER